ncbi:STAS domain-containing protein [Paraconexibacter antarcticus]|uniref:STAS domain-containing protein n=1 Tax=Paraconexibacter antarcticus TaxID=2949664 RepID=UPI00346088EF
MVSFSEQTGLLICKGDEDRTTQARRRRALSRSLASTVDVRVDLSELVFADASLMVDLAMVARRLRKAGRRLYLQDAQPQIRRLIEIVGLDRLAGVTIAPLPA